MSQPTDRSCTIPPAGTLDEKAGQFWVGNAWAIVQEEKNLSAYENNCTYLNLGDNKFADVSFITGSDNDGDGRATITADLNSDGMQDLVVRQAGGGPLLIFLNRFPPKNHLRVILRGRDGQSNAAGLGARLVATVGQARLVRELYSLNSFACQHPAEAYFGLGDAEQIDRLEISWPSGLVQELRDIAKNRLVRITEGSDEIETIRETRR